MGSVIFINEKMFITDYLYRHACIKVNEHFGMIACTSFGRQNVENEDVSGCLYFYHVYLPCDDHI